MGCGVAWGFGGGHPWKLDRLVAVAGRVVFLKVFKVAFFLQGDQGFDVAVEFVHIANSTLEGFDLIAQILNSTGLTL